MRLTEYLEARSRSVLAAIGVLLLGEVVRIDYITCTRYAIVAVFVRRLISSYEFRTCRGGCSARSFHIRQPWLVDQYCFQERHTRTNPCGIGTPVGAA